MSRGMYFYDQYARVSHLGGVQRYKRHHDELNQALHQHRIAVAADNDQAGGAQPMTPAMTAGQTPSPNKQQLQFAKQTNEHLLKTIQRKFQSSFVPDLLFKELDRFFQRYDDDDDDSGAVSSEATPKVLSSHVKKSKTTGDHDKDAENNFMIEEVDDEHDLINRAVNRPKLSLPASLILRLHSSWADLIGDTRYRFPVRLVFVLENEEGRKSFFLFKRFGERRAAKTNGAVRSNGVESIERMRRNYARNRPANKK